MHPPLLALALGLGLPPLAEFLDVGQGAAALFVSEHGEVVLVDSGPSSGAEVIVDALRRREIGSVDLWVHTHFDADHVGGYARVVAGADAIEGTDDDVFVVSAWDRGTSHLPDTGAVAAYLERAPRSAIVERTTFEGEGIHVTVHSSPTPDAESENERGLSVCIELDGKRVFVPGDLPASLSLPAAAECTDPTVLWAAHHGSREGTSSELLDLLEPRLVVVSAGMGNPYCHPHEDTLARLQAHEVLLTQLAAHATSDPCGAAVAALGPSHTLVGTTITLDLRAL